MVLIHDSKYQDYFLPRYVFKARNSQKTNQKQNILRCYNPTLLLKNPYNKIKYKFYPIFAFRVIVTGINHA